MITWATPLYLFLLLPLGLAGLAVLSARPDSDIRFASVTAARHARHTWRIRLVRTLPILYLLGLLLLVLALAGPRISRTTHERVADAIGMFMAVDVSGSMGARDLPPPPDPAPTRLDLAKRVFADFISTRPDDHIGLITFGGYAITRAPLTRDHTALLNLLETVDIPGEGGSGSTASGQDLLTALGDAVVTACARLERSDLRSRVVVLLTDGASNTGHITPLQAALVARRLGIRLYTIGLMPEHDARQDAQGLLATLATQTDGQHFLAHDRAGLQAALASISQLETTPVRVLEHTGHLDLWPAMVLAAAAVLAITVSLSFWLRGRTI